MVCPLPRSLPRLNRANVIWPFVPGGLAAAGSAAIAATATASSATKRTRPPKRNLMSPPSPSANGRGRRACRRSPPALSGKLDTAATKGQAAREACRRTTRKRQHSPSTVRQRDGHAASRGHVWGLAKRTAYVFLQKPVSNSCRTDLGAIWQRRTISGRTAGRSWASAARLPAQARAVSLVRRSR